MGVSVDRIEKQLEELRIFSVSHQVIKFISFEPLIGDVGRVSLAGINCGNSGR